MLSITVYVHCNVHYFDFWFPKIYAFKINGHVFPFVYPTYLCTQEAGIGKTNSSSARFFTSCEYSREFLVIQGVHQYWIYYSNYKTHRAFKNAFSSNFFTEYFIYSCNQYLKKLCWGFCSVRLAFLWASYLSIIKCCLIQMEFHKKRIFHLVWITIELGQDPLFSNK